MHSTNFFLRHRTGISLLILALTAFTANAQKPTVERKPDVSNKALVTKQTPESKKKTPPKTADTAAVKQ